MPEAFEKLVDGVKRMTLSAEEKSRGRDMLLQFMRMRPVREENPARQHLVRGANGSFWFLSVKSPLATKVMSIILIIALLLGGSTSFAAERALPGDTLYPVKVHVNEEVRALAAVSRESKAAWDVERAERRLLEAEELAHDGRLMAHAQAEIEGNFKAHADRVHARIADFKGRSDFQAAADLSSNFESSLRAHERILAKLAEAGEEDQEKLSDLIREVQVRTATTTRVRIEAEGKLSLGTSADVKAAAEGKLRAAELKIAEVRQFLGNAKARLGMEASVEAEVRLKIAEDTVVQGKVKLVNDAYGEAFSLFQRAKRIAQEAKLLIRARDGLRIHVRLDGHNESEGEKIDIEKEHERDPDVEDDEHSSTSVHEENEKGGRGHRDAELKTEDETEAEAEFHGGSATTEEQLQIHLGL